MKQTSAWENEVVQEQIAAWDHWTRLKNQAAKVLYPQATAKRVMLAALRRYGIPRRSQQRVLEVGFGFGDVVFWFRPPTVLRGVEISPSALASATRRAAKRRHFDAVFSPPCPEDSVRTPFPDGFFDVVLASHTIEHVYDDSAFLKELLRVTRPGGAAFILAPLDVVRRSDVLSIADRRNPAFPDDSFHVWRYNIDTLRSLAADAGFDVIEATQCDALSDERRTMSRPHQILLSLLWAMAPHSLWRARDRVSHRRGFLYRQGLVVASRRRR